MSDYVTGFVMEKGVDPAGKIGMPLTDAESDRLHSNFGDEIVCMTCRWWSLKHKPFWVAGGKNSLSDLHVHPQFQGTCQFHPPVPSTERTNASAVWPITDYCDKCSEWEQETVDPEFEVKE